MTKKTDPVVCSLEPVRDLPCGENPFFRFQLKHINHLKTNLSLSSSVQYNNKLCFKEGWWEHNTFPRMNRAFPCSFNLLVFYVAITIYTFPSVPPVETLPFTSVNGGQIGNIKNCAAEPEPLHFAKGKN